MARRGGGGPGRRARSVLEGWDDAGTPCVDLPGLASRSPWSGNLGSGPVRDLRAVPRGFLWTIAMLAMQQLGSRGVRGARCRDRGIRQWDPRSPVQWYPESPDDFPRLFVPKGGEAAFAKLVFVAAPSRQPVLVGGREAVADEQPAKRLDDKSTGTLIRTTSPRRVYRHICMRGWGGGSYRGWPSGRPAVSSGGTSTRANPRACT